MRKRIKFFLSLLFLSVIYWLIRLYLKTIRLTVENEAAWLDHLQHGGKVVLCTWHQQFFTAIGHFKTYAAYRPALMISKSRDGDVIAGIASRSGWLPVRGSSSKEGKEALEAVIHHLGTHSLAGHVVDGPRGPRGMVKPGLIKLAHRTGAAIVPFFVRAERAWHLKSWDRFIVPKPFSRVTLTFSDMIQLEPTCSKEDREAQRLEIERIMKPWLSG